MKYLTLLLLLFISPLFHYAQPVSLDWVSANDQAGEALAIAVSSDGSSYYVGRYFSTKDFDPGPNTFNLSSNGASDVFILKLDLQGNFVWAKSLGSTGLDFASDITIDNQNNLFLIGQYKNTVDFDPGAGTYNLTSAGNDDVFLLKLSSNGDFLWAKSFGGSAYEKGESVKIGNNGDIYIAGTFQNTADFNPGNASHNLTANSTMDSYILKLNSQGNFVWVKQLGSNGAVEIQEVDIDQSNNIVAVGHYYQTLDADPGPAVFNLPSNGQLDVFVCKLDLNGNFIFAKSFGGAFQDQAYEVEFDLANNIYIGGYFYSTVDFDPSSGTSVRTPNGNEDMYISKFSSTGNFLWVQTIGGSYTYDRIHCMEMDSFNQLNFAGSFSNTVDFDPSSATYNLVGSGNNSDAFIAQLNSNGDLNWAYPIISGPFNGFTGNDQVTAMTIDNNGAIYTAGSVYGPADFNVDPNQVNMAGRGNFYQKTSQMSVGLNDEDFKNELSLFPNPANSIVQISSHENIQNLLIYDLSGKVVQTIKSPGNSIQVEELPSGIYFLEFYAANGAKTIKRLVVNH